MPSKNDLSALKGATKKPVILPSNNTSPVADVHTTTNPTKGQGAGRPPKAKAEKRSYKVTLSLTQSEGAKLAEKSGLAGEATYLYAKLKELNII
ncbi:MAG: hypothetical protein GY761_16390 [Hyphomicrobiales bacterium]|nr:hypothetical protein [Hyphomicrobiales bacterium]